MASANEEYGGRNRDERTPAAPASTSWFWASSRSMRLVDWYERSGWLNVCSPTSWPSSTMRFTSAG